MTSERLEELRGLLAKATKGPWSAQIIRSLCLTRVEGRDRELVADCDVSTGHGARSVETCSANAQLIVALVNSASDLLAAASETEELRKERDAYERAALANCRSGKRQVKSRVGAAFEAGRALAKRREALAADTKATP